MTPSEQSVISSSTSSFSSVIQTSLSSDLKHVFLGAISLLPRMINAGGLSYSMSLALSASSMSKIVNVEYAMFRTLHIGKVLVMVSIVSLRSAPCCSMVIMILLVKVAKILAFTPLPNPSAKTMIVRLSLFTISTLSPQSSSLNLLMECAAISINGTSITSICQNEFFEFVESHFRLCCGFTKNTCYLLSDSHLFVYDFLTCDKRFSFYAF